MPFPFTAANRDQRLGLWFPLLIIYLLFNLSYSVEAEDEKNVTNIGAIIDANSRIGKEQKVAMEIAADNFNDRSNTHELILHFRDSGRDPFLAASAAKELINEKKVQVVIGMETWQEVVTVADVVQNLPDQIPVISFASPAITPPLIQRRWPFLIRMGSDGAAQMKCIGDIVSAYNWKRVVVIYEDDGYGGDVGMLALLSETIRNVGSKIELRLVLPRLSSSQNWDEVEELLGLVHDVQSRAFIVLQSSLPTVTQLFKVAQKKGLVGADSAWIITERITSLLDPRGNDDMEGTLGIKTYYIYANSTSSYAKFNKSFQTKYSEEDKSGPGIYALRAYDVISILTDAISSNTTNTSLQESLPTMLSNYKGLSGIFQFEGGEVLLDSPSFRIINIVDGKTDTELNFWTPEFGFSETLAKESETKRSRDVGKVNWPGNLTRASKGWAMPTAKKPMKILLPTHHKKFVRLVDRENSDEMIYKDLCSDKRIYEGLSIELFCMVLKNLSYLLPNEFRGFNGTYNEAVELVYNKTYDAVIGDTTVIAERIDKVDFTQPYMESGLSMIVPDKSKGESTWLFMKPFTWQMWVATCGILMYTTLIVWFLEGPSNSEFVGQPFKNQIATATWFTFSSLFFAHREQIYSKLTRVVFVVWLFVVLILNSSYTANLSSMLTIQRLSPNVTDIAMLKRTNSFVGCDNNSFVKNYLQNVLDFNSSNFKEVGSDLTPEDFQNKTLSAVFLELPYAEVFMNENCSEGYTMTKATYSFGGFSFAFQKGSPIARDFSMVFLQLLQNGAMTTLQNNCLTPKTCPNNATNSDIPESLRLQSFWGLFVISGAISTLCFLLSLAIWVKSENVPTTPTTIPMH